jgi:hypothetical protein
MVWMLMFAVPLGVGVVLLARGWRGRRVNDHPLCRACGYDLSGTVGVPGVERGAGAADEAAMCPECGADLAVKRAVRHGQRRRRPVMLGIALVLLVSSGGGLGTAGWAWAKDFDWNTVKPVWWLRWQAGSVNRRTAHDAWFELCERVKNGRLQDATVVSVYDQILARHADSPRTLSGGAWGFARVAALSGAIDEADVRRLFDQILARQADQSLASPTDGFRFACDIALTGVIDRADVERYLTALITQTIEVMCRPQIHVGDPLPVKIAIWPVPVDLAPLLLPGSRSTQLELVLRVVPNEPPAGKAPKRDTDSVKTMRLPEDGATTRTLLPVDSSSAGSRHATLRIVVVHRGERDPKERGEPEPVVWATERTERPLEFEVVPADQIIVRPVRDESLAHAIREILFIDLINTTVSYDRYEPSSRKPPRAGFIGIGESPVNLAFDIVGRHGGVEKLLEQRTKMAKGSPTGWFFEKDIREHFPDAQAIDVIFRSNIHYAELEFRMDTVWDGEIVFKDVPIRGADDDGDADGS